MDEIDDDDESLTLSFTDPHVRSGGTNETATIVITDNDDCVDIDIWCATVEFGATVHWVGRYDLYTGEADEMEFSYNGADYRLLGVRCAPERSRCRRRQPCRTALRHTRTDALAD